MEKKEIAKKEENEKKGMEPAKDEKNIEEKYLEMQFIEKKINEIDSQLSQLNDQIAELAAIRNAVDELAGSNVDEMLAQIAPGIYVKVKAEKLDKFIINVGANTAVSKDSAGLKEYINSQIKEIEKIRDEQVNVYNLLANRFNRLYEEIKGDST